MAEIEMPNYIWKRIKKKAKKPTAKSGKYAPSPSKEEENDAWERWRNGLQICDKNPKVSQG